MDHKSVWFYWTRSFLGVYTPKKSYDHTPGKTLDTPFDKIVGTPILLPFDQRNLSLDELAVLYPHT